MDNRRFKALFCTLLFALCCAIQGAEDNKLLARFALRLDAIEKKFWRIAPLPEDNRSRQKFSTELYELENMARVIRTHCAGLKDKSARVPDLYNDTIMLTRTYNQFRVNSKFKVRNFTIYATGMHEYQKRHNKFMRDKAGQEAEESGEKRKKTSKYKWRPRLNQVDIDDYNEFLDDIADKNCRRFAGWADGLKSREKSKTAEDIFAVWQKSICNLRMNLVILAQQGVFREEKKSNVSSNNRR